MHGILFHLLISNYGNSSLHEFKRNPDYGGHKHTLGPLWELQLQLLSQKPHGVLIYSTSHPGYTIYLNKSDLSMICEYRHEWLAYHTLNILPSILELYCQNGPKWLERVLQPLNDVLLNFSMFLIFYVF